MAPRWKSGYAIYNKKAKELRNARFSNIFHYLIAYARNPVGKLTVSKELLEKLHSERKLTKIQKIRLINKLAEVTASVDRSS